MCVPKECPLLPVLWWDEVIGMWSRWGAFLKSTKQTILTWHTKVCPLDVTDCHPCYRLVLSLFYLNINLYYTDNIYILSYSNIVQSRNDDSYLGTYSRFLSTELRHHQSTQIQGIHPDPCVWCSLLSHLDEGVSEVDPVVVSPTRDPWPIHGTNGILIYLILVDFYGINVGTYIIYPTWMLFMIRVFFGRGSATVYPILCVVFPKTRDIEIFHLYMSYGVTKQKSIQIAMVTWSQVLWVNPQVSWVHPQVSWVNPQVSWVNPQVSWVNPQVLWVNLNRKGMVESCTENLPTHGLHGSKDGPQMRLSVQ